jgi:hypothetical protein
MLLFLAITEPYTLCNIPAVPISLQAKRLQVARSLEAQVERVVGETADTETVTGVRHDDRGRARGIPCLVRGGLGSAIPGTRPGSDEHLDML